MAAIIPVLTTGEGLLTVHSFLLIVPYQMVCIVFHTLTVRINCCGGETGPEPPLAVAGVLAEWWEPRRL